MEEDDWKRLGIVLSIIGTILSLSGLYLCMQTVTVTLFGRHITIYPYFQAGLTLFFIGFSISIGGTVMRLFGKKKPRNNSKG